MFFPIQKAAESLYKFRRERLGAHQPSDAGQWARVPPEQAPQKYGPSPFLWGMLCGCWGAPSLSCALSCRLAGNVAVPGNLRRAGGVVG